MRGPDIQQANLFSSVRPEDRVPKAHPLRRIRKMVNDALKELDQEFAAIYAPLGRDSIPPEKLLRAQLLQILYTIRSERLLMEQINYNLLFRWFVGFSMDDPVWNHSTFSKNRERLMEAEVAHKFFARVLAQARKRKLLSDEHFSVDGTLIEAWASAKSFRPKDDDSPPPSGGGRNPEVDFHGQKRCNDTHASTTDPEARMARKGKGKEAKLSFQGHLLMENRNGLVVDGRVTEANGTAERDAALGMVEALSGTHRVTLGADKGYDAEAFVALLRELKATPHIAQNDTSRSSAIDGRTTRHPGYAVSLCKRIEECFGWAKTVGGLRKSRFVGRAKLDFMFMLTFAAYNLVRMRNLELEGCR